jgi:hypothetical protein
MALYQFLLLFLVAVIAHSATSFFLFFFASDTVCYFVVNFFVPSSFIMQIYGIDFAKTKDIEKGGAFQAAAERRWVFT